MGLQVVPGYIGQSGYQHPVELFRNQLKAHTAGGKGYMKSATDFAMTPSGAGLSLGVAEGWAAIPGVESASQGSYFVWSNGTDNIAWPAASGQPRIDSLILRVIDKQYGTDPDANGSQWEVCQGTPAASPVAIADVEFDAGGDFHRPGAWWRVANVTISPGNTVMTSTTITDLRAYADFQRTNNNTLKTWYDNTLNSAWTTYSPTHTSDTGSPTIGSGGVLSGLYKQLGKTVFYRGRLLFGTGASFGTGGWYVSLPVTARNVVVGGTPIPHIGSAYIRDTSATGNGHFLGQSVIDASSNASRLTIFTSLATQLTFTSPWSPNAAATDHFSWEIVYEAA